MTANSDKPYRLMAPGPVQMPPEIYEGLAQPMIHHRTPEFTKILTETLEKLKQVFKTSQGVFIHTSTGSGALESAVVNTLSPGDEVLCVISGKFGERWGKICNAYGIKVHVIQVPLGEAVNLKEFETQLKKQKNIKAVFSQACETSSAVLHPIKEMALAVKTHSKALFIVDAISAIGTTKLKMDTWEIDVMIGGSQKSFMMPTGLSFISLSEKAWKQYESSTCPKFYFDLKQEKLANEKGQTFFSSPVSHIRALNKSLDRLLGENLTKLIHRSQTMAKATRKSGQEIGLELFSKEPSPSVTAFKVPDAIDGTKLRQHVEDEFNITIMGGQDELKGKIIRVGHIGYISNNDILATMEAIGKSLIKFGHPIKEEKLSRALQTAELILENTEI